MSSQACDFSAWEVNPDSVSNNPPAMCTVRYPVGEVQLGKEMGVPDTQNAPSVHWEAKEGKKYTVMMVDPDAPSRKTHTFRNWLHWLVCNVPGSDKISEGFTMATYKGPGPPPKTGLHRYVFLIYEQRADFEGDQLRVIAQGDAPEARKGFKVGDFLQKHSQQLQAEDLVAGNMFQAQNSEQ